MTVTVSTASSAAKFFRLSSAVRVFVLHAARRNHSSGSVFGVAGLGQMHQRLGWHAADVDARQHLVGLFDHGDARAVATHGTGDELAAGAEADDDQIHS
jgi:hypothetical protein